MRESERIKRLTIIEHSILAVKSTYCKSTKMFADMIFLQISRISTKQRKCHVREYEFKELFAQKV